VDFVCLHTNTEFQYYYSNDTCEKLENQRLIYVNAQCMPDLLLDGEWPYYIKQSGFVRYYKDILPTQIFKFCLNY